MRTAQSALHALCGAHLLRELAFIVDAHDYAWAKRMSACSLAPVKSPNATTNAERQPVQGAAETLPSILTQGARELPPIPPRQNGQRGKVAKSDAHNLWERMPHETAVLRFAKHPDVAFTNNRAERDLRMAKVKQKVSGCFRTRKYAQAYCRISSYLQSMANVTTRWWPFRSLSPGLVSGRKPPLLHEICDEPPHYRRGFGHGTGRTDTTERCLASNRSACPTSGH